MAEVFGHVVARERQHGERIAAHDALLARCSGGRLRPHRRGHVNALDPVARFGDQRHGGAAAPTEDEGIDRHAGRVVPLAIERRVVGGGDGEARVRVGGLGARLLCDLGRPVLTLPVDQVGRRFLGHALPPHVAIVGQRDVGEDDVAGERGHAVGVGGFVGARRDAEVTGLRVDGVQAAIRARLDPRDVVTDGGDLPALEAFGRDQHGKVGLAAGRRKRRRDVILLALRVGDAEDKHVLCQPTVAQPHVRRNAQREALFAEQRVAAIARAVAPDLARLGEVHDVFRLVARPRDVLLPGREWCADGVHAGHKLAALAEHLNGAAAHAGHDLHVHGDVGRIRQLNADVGDWRTQRAHRERHHVHRAARHRALEQRLQRGAHVGRGHPVVGGTSVFFLFAADEGAVFNAGNVGRVTAREVGIRALGFVQLFESAGLDQLAAQAVVLFGAAIAPVNAGRLRERGHFAHPGEQANVFDVGRGLHRGLQSGERFGLIHEWAKDGVATERKRVAANRRSVGPCAGCPCAGGWPCFGV